MGTWELNEELNRFYQLGEWMGQYEDSWGCWWRVSTVWPLSIMTSCLPVSYLVLDEVKNLLEPPVIPYA